METYYPPTYRGSAFTCLHCGVYATQIWCDAYSRFEGSAVNIFEALKFCYCRHCSNWSYWNETKLIFPTQVPVPLPHEDMPVNSMVDYNEARNVVAMSPKAASALLRLALQKLMKDLGERGENINADIKELVSRGLPVQVQQALDFCRVVGNNAVHPGEINLDDTPEIAHQLFVMLNFIVEDRIARPKQIQALYDQLPEGARNAIEVRDQK